MENIAARRAELQQAFVTLYGESTRPIRLFRAPGRVNIIGEHTDYNGGLVLPAAIDYSTLVLARLRDDDIIRLESTDYAPGATVRLSDISPEKSRWADYALGVVVELQKLGKTMGGVDILYAGNVPSGAGLSSSASVEVAMAVAMNALFNLRLTQIELVQLSQAAEHNFIGVNCGIMDQFSVAMGREHFAIALNCKTLAHEYVSAKLDGYSLFVINTNKRRGLADSKYNERRAQCEAGLAILQGAMPEKECLGDIAPDEYEAHKHLIADPVIRSRVEHVVYEDARVGAAMKALASGDAAGVAAAMNGSHHSLRDLYEVTGAELDALHAEGMLCPGALAVRMTGAGFGGCAVAFVKTESLEAFEGELRERYMKAIGYEPTFYRIELADGACEVTCG